MSIAQILWQTTPCASKESASTASCGWVCRRPQKQKSSCLVFQESYLHASGFEVVTQGRVARTLKRVARRRNFHGSQTGNRN